MAEGVAAKATDIGNGSDHGHPASSALVASEFALFAQVAKPRRIDAGTVLFRRGDLGTSMFVIAEGAVELDFGEDLLHKRLGTHEFFGELGLLIGDHARSADATAATDSVLLELGRQEFDLLANRDAKVLAHFLRRAITRVVDNEQGLIARVHRRNQELQTALESLRTTTQKLNHTEALSRIDELTALTNRRGFSLHVEQRRKKGGLAGCSLMLVDCDRFKGINDDHGHLAGDRVLQGVANLIRAVAGPDDMACRLGGDEFCLLLRGQSRDDVTRIAGYIVESARMLQRMHSTPPQMTTLSVGACMIGEDGDWESWYGQADSALYRAKRLGGNRVEWPD